MDDDFIDREGLVFDQGAGQKESTIFIGIPEIGPGEGKIEEAKENKGYCSPDRKSVV